MESLIISKHIIFYYILVMQVYDVLRYITKYNLYHKYICMFSYTSIRVCKQYYIIKIT